VLLPTPEVSVSTSTLSLRQVVIPRSTLATDAALVIGGAALVAASAQVSIPLPFTPVPITGQTFAVLLVGASLGSLRGCAALGLYLLVGLLGAPIYADQNHGWDVLRGATGGYIRGFVLAALVVGWLAERRYDRTTAVAVTTFLTGEVIVFTIGCAWLSHVLGTGLDRTLELGLYPFVIGELLKIYLAGALVPGAWRLVSRLRS
jgi:biotin transport system substrate-specific component